MTVQNKERMLFLDLSVHLLDLCINGSLFDKIMDGISY